MNSAVCDGRALVPQAASTGRSRALFLLICACVAMVALGTIGVWSSWKEGRAQAAVITAQAAETGRVASMARLSTGKQAEVLDQGEDAQDRNALIPVSTLPLEGVKGFGAAGQMSASYDTAVKCLTQAIYYEAANEPLTGKRAVAQVVLNRVAHPAYPRSVCGVVYQGSNQRVCQFSFTCDGSLLRAPMQHQWGQAREVARAALAGSIEKSVGTATHYHADYVLPRWAFTLGKIGQIGRHIFYRFPGSAGTSRAFSARWSGSEAIPSLDYGRLREELATDVTDVAVVPETVPGLTIAPHVADRHTPSDVGGRLDTTRGWTLSIPDPTQASSTYRATLNRHGAAAEAAPAEAQQ